MAITNLNKSENLVTNTTVASKYMISIANYVVYVVLSVAEHDMI